MSPSTQIPTAVKATLVVRGVLIITRKISRPAGVILRQSDTRNLARLQLTDEEQAELLRSVQAEYKRASQATHATRRIAGEQ